MRRSAVTVGMVAASLVVGGVAYASIPDSGGVIHGCIKSNSMVRIIDSDTTSCASGETSINWNQAGPVGPVGPVGPQGDPASVHPNSLYGLHVEVHQQVVTPGATVQKRVGCLDGDNSITVTGNGPGVLKMGDAGDLNGETTNTVKGVVVSSTVYTQVGSQDFDNAGNSYQQSIDTENANDGETTTPYAVTYEFRNPSATENMVWVIRLECASKTS